MPTFTFTSPDGKSYDVQGPDGATKEQAFQILQQRLGPASGASPAAQGRTAAPLERLPPDVPGGNQQPKNADDIAHRLLGVGEAGLSAVTGAVGGAAGQLYGIGKTLTSGKFGTQAGIQEGEKAGVDLANRLTYQPRTQTGQQLAEGAGRLMEASRLQGMPVEGPMIARLPDVPRGMLAAGEGAAGAVRAGANAAGKTAGRAVASTLPEVDPGTLQLARQAHAMGFRLTPDMVYGNKYARGAGELAQDNPFVGKTVREHNQQVFNSHLVNAIGGEGNKLTRKTFSEAMDRSGKTIGDIAEKYPLPVDQSFTAKLRANGANQLPEVRGVVDKYVEQIDKAAGKPANLVGGGRTAAPRELPGPVFRRINTALSKQIRETTNGDLRSALRGVQDDLLEERSQHMSQSDLDAYNEARRQYAIGMTLEPLVAKSSTGNISPAALLGVVTRNAAGKSAMARGTAGQMGVLADIGQRFLKEQPSSGTAERSLMQNLMTHPVGSLAAGGTAALSAPVARAYNQYGPNVTQMLLDRPPQ
jgi:hypothetical protein